MSKNIQLIIIVKKWNQIKHQFYTLFGKSGINKSYNGIYICIVVACVEFRGSSQTLTGNLFPI